MSENIFVTGSTGLLGSYIVKKLCEWNIGNIIALCRGETESETRNRILQEVERNLSDRERRKISGRIKVVRGDIIEKKLGLSDSAYNSLSKEIMSIYHCAALCKFNIQLDVARKVNVHGTENILKFALLCKRNRQFKAVHHISTVGVAGDSDGIFYETNLDVGQGFNNAYEQSKFEAEKLVTKYRTGGLPITIYRPGVITGDSISGYTNNFEMIYRPLQMFFIELFNEIPADKDSIYSFVPVDCTADAIIRISLDDNTHNLTYHIVNPDYVTFGKFVDVASRYFKFKKPLFISREKFDFKKLSPFQFNVIKPFVPYFNYKLRYDSTQAQAILNMVSFEWPKISDVFLRRLFKYCIQCKFIIPGRKFSLGILSRL